MFIIILTISKQNRLIQSCGMEPIMGNVFLRNSAFPGLIAAVIHLSCYFWKGPYLQAPPEIQEGPAPFLPAPFTT